MGKVSLPDFSLLCIEDLHEKFDLCHLAQHYKIDFKEYALLYRIMEGVKPPQVFESLFVSHATMCRCRHTLVNKFKAASFEQALILVGKMDLLNE